MSVLPDSLPTFGPMQAMLRDVTERLAAELMAPAGAPPPWNELQWAVARSVASMQGISGLLASRLRWRAPVDFLEFIAGQREHVAAVQQHARQLLGQLDTQARTAGVPFIALKGSALLALDLHAPGERPMGDIDVLVEGTQVEAMSKVIVACGYEHAYNKRRHDVFQPRSLHPAHAYAEHRDNPLRIELHARISEQLPVSVVDITKSLWPGAPQPGLNAYANLPALMRHNLLHAAGNMRAHALRGIQLYDIAALARRLQPDDWRELLGAAPADCWWMLPPLALAERYVPGGIPPAVLERCAAACPRWLRYRSARHTLHGVSWSDLRIHALPGVEWSRTPLEALRFAKSRIVPDPVALRELADGVQAQPAIRVQPWYDLPHVERIVRWITSRPPRVQTITSVRAACAEHRPSAP